MAYKPAFSDKMQEELVYRKKRDRATYEQVMKKIALVLETPNIGKPMRAPLHGIRRFHVGHLVVTYRVNEEGHEVVFTSFEHHE
ncbi:MAG: type II toxin-antitoxin system RelE/ParE family toxin [Candidatus Micrarchaeota archaeon]|nr:type II toxin-antitoxin system RelE/ParE family toxin [Candidatus Micrarchaeota archaeon]